jgi:hypothetical protein
MNHITDQRECLLGKDSEGDTYIHFPQFCGADLRVYKVIFSQVYSFRLFHIHRFGKKGEKIHPSIHPSIHSSIHSFIQLTQAPWPELEKVSKKQMRETEEAAEGDHDDQTDSQRSVTVTQNSLAYGVGCLKG